MFEKIKKAVFNYLEIATICGFIGSGVGATIVGSLMMKDYYRYYHPERLQFTVKTAEPEVTVNENNT